MGHQIEKRVCGAVKTNLNTSPRARGGVVGRGGDSLHRNTTDGLDIARVVATHVVALIAGHDAAQGGVCGAAAAARRTRALTVADGHLARAVL